MKTINLILATLISLTAYSQTFFYDTPTGTITDSLGNNVDGQTFSTCADPADVSIFISYDSSAVNPLDVSFQNTDQGNTSFTTYSLYDLFFNWSVIPSAQFFNWIMPSESGTMVFNNGTNQVSINFVNQNDIDQTALVTNYETCSGLPFSFDPTTYGALNVASWYVNNWVTGTTLYPDSTGVVSLTPYPYEVIMFNSTGCQSSAFINVNTVAPVTGILNVSICPGDQYTSPQSNSYTVGTYTETYISSVGCDSIVTINVIEFSDTLLNISFVNPTGCGYDDGQIILTNLLADSTYCVYFENDSTGIKDTYIADGSGVITIGGLGSGVYQNFMMQNPCGTSIYDSTTIITLTDPLPITPIVTASQDTICIDLAESSTLSVNNPADFILINWMPANAANPFTTFIGGTYYANVIDVNNCPTVSDSITIVALDVCDTNTSSLEELQIQKMQKEYYNLSGKKIQRPEKGIYLEVTKYENGAIQSEMNYK